MHDTVIRGARVVDGTGAPAFYADIAVEGDTIAAIGGGLFGRREIAADGLTATPGQIDIHNHSDLRIWDAPEAKNYLHQGVTTMLGGNCGICFAPTLAPGSPAAGTGIFPRAWTRWRRFQRATTWRCWWATAPSAPGRWAWRTRS
jgi:N-acyl-D-amino-acid deacylase